MSKCRQQMPKPKRKQKPQTIPVEREILKAARQGGVGGLPVVGAARAGVLDAIGRGQRVVIIPTISWRR
jgi:hypothetical protein